jgi:VWFA-related protein
MAISRWKSVGAGLILATFCTFPGDAQQPAPPEGQGGPTDAGREATQEPPVFRTGINFVRVDVIVTDSKTGQPVTDLQPSDFVVVEDKQPQKVETFKLVKLDGGITDSLAGPPRDIRSDSDEELEAGRDDVRLFAIFLDDYHVRRGASVSVREPIARFIETQLGPSDMVGVMYPLQAVSAVRMTRDRRRMLQSLESFVGRKGDYTPRNRLEEQYANYPAEEVELIRNQVSFSAIKGLISHLGSLKEGRKALILISEGYSNTLPPQLRDPIAALPGVDNPSRDDPAAGLNDRDEDRRQFFADSTLQLSMREVWDMANKNNVAIYAVDPRRLPTSEFDLSQPTVSPQVDRQYLNATMDTLRVLAEQTDGRAIVNRNDLGNGMRQIVRDTSAYYLLGYNSTQAPSDGRFHEIKVQVKRPGVQVRARPGYWALTVQDVARALAPKVETPADIDSALAAISVPAAAYNVVRTWIGTSRGAEGKTKVTFVWEPMPRGAQRDARAEAPARVMVTAVGPDGAPYFRGRVPDAAAAPLPPGVATPRSRVEFEADPGKMQLRLSVEGSSSQVLDVQTRDLVVPDLASSDIVFGTPQLLRGRTARDIQQLKADPNPVPTATREFSRADRLLVRVPVYGPGGVPPAITAQLLNRTGQPMNNQVVVAPSPSPDVQELELALAGLAPGEYLLEVKAGELKELVGFRVTP